MTQERLTMDSVPAQWWGFWAVRKQTSYGKMISIILFNPEFNKNFLNGDTAFRKENF